MEQLRHELTTSQERASDLEASVASTDNAQPTAQLKHLQKEYDTLLDRWVEPLNFTRGQFWPLAIVVACVCVCVSPSVCQPQACPNDNLSPFQLESPNLDKGCKTPLLRSLLLF